MFNTKDELKEWIINYLENKGKRSLHIAINNSYSIKDKILEYTNFLPIDSKYSQRCYHIINDITDIPLCKTCKVNSVSFNNRNKDWKYLDNCSNKCGRLNRSSINKYKNTCLEKYGVDNFSKTDKFKKNMISKNLEKYGYEWYQETDEFKEKSIKRCLEKYGVSSYTKTKEFTERVSNIFIENWGVDWYTKSEDFKEKFRQTCLSKYGTEHHMNSSIFLEKFNSYKSEDYKLPSGKIVKVQGYEKYAIDLLLSRYDEDDIMITYTDIKSEIGVLNYIMDSKNRIYLPDIYIKSEDKIIEVKSLYTYEIQIDKNLLKKESCLKSGINFEFWIMSNDGKLIEVK